MYTYKNDDGRLKCDLVRFAADLAKELGATVTTEPGGYPNERQTLRLGADELLVGCNQYGREMRVDVSIRAPDIRHEDRNHYAAQHKTGSASVNPAARSIAAIAKDIRKRVVDASAEALAAQRSYATNAQNGRAELRKQADTLVKRFSKLDVRMEPNSDTATIFNRDGHYLHARLTTSGVTIDRIGSLSLDQFAKLVELINGK
jgi:hypothetical protein